MSFKLRRPCAHCPFRTDIRPFLTKGGAREISDRLLCGESFPCHKTVDYDDDDSGVVTSDSQQCAGAMIILEKLDLPNQMMRIGERLGLYKWQELDMNAPVFNNFDDFVEVQER